MSESKYSAQASMHMTIQVRVEFKQPWSGKDEVDTVALAAGRKLTAIRGHLKDAVESVDLMTGHGVILTVTRMSSTDLEPVTVVARPKC